MKTIHFIAGLPRSGSTLLCNILAQNPRFAATHTSGCIDVLLGIRNSWRHSAANRAHYDPKAMENVARAAMYAYHDSFTDRPVVFDKCRGWMQHFEFTEHILNHPVKILLPCRAVPDILASFEKLHRETSRHQLSPLDMEMPEQPRCVTVGARCAKLMEPMHVVGWPLNAMQELILRAPKESYHFVEFTELTGNPEKTMKEIYNFLEEEYYAHDFNHVEQVTQEDDAVHGYVNLHTIRNKVDPVPSQAKEILGEVLFNKFNRN